MILIVLGVALWAAAHLFKRLAPGARARLGSAGMGLVALALVASVVLMVVGYRGVPHVDLWFPPAFLTHVNNLAMVGAVYLYASDGFRGRVATSMRHPQLTAFKIWAVAHLLVNGDLASALLFGGLLAWAVVTVILINRANRDWARRTARPGAEPKVIAATIFAVVGVMLIHNWLGVQPWG